MKKYAAGLAGLLVLACAQVPRESVELSTTVGKDLVEVHKAHRELAELMFQGMRDDVNRFVDEVYAPFQIQFVIDAEQEKATSSSDAVRKMSLLAAMGVAFAKPPADEDEETRAKRANLQKQVLEKLGVLVSGIEQDIEDMRRELLQPLEAQRAEVIGSIDRNYQRIHYANSVVMGHLSTVVKVHDAQEEALNAIGIEGLREKAGTSLARTSNQVGELVNRAERAGGTLDELEETITDTKAKLLGAIGSAGSTDGATDTN